LDEENVMQPRFEPITPSIGANVHISAEHVLDDGVPETLVAALEKYDVLVFPQVRMDDATYSEMTARMGPMHDLGVTAEAGTGETDAGLYRVSLEKEDQLQLDFVRGNNLWHMDGTVYDTPGKATCLKCEVEPSEGGDTGFASLNAAWQALPEARKAELEPLRVRHDFRAVGRKLYAEPTAEQYATWDAIFPPKEHPLIWHQQSGHTSMLIGATGDDIVGMAPADGAALIGELAYRHRWREGDIVIFHNPALLHRSFPYSKDSGRLMLRATIAGTEPIR
jgi:alpha-ketoglutarate-dependent taurine dioxygenase